MWRVELVMTNVGDDRFYWWWHLTAANNKVLARSETYLNRGGALRIGRLVAERLQVPFVDRTSGNR